MRWVKYHNGNYDVFINLENGTKVRKNDLDNLTPEFPESFDYKITNKCHHNCPMCHENSNPSGVHGNIMNDKFIEVCVDWEYVGEFIDIGFMFGKLK